MGFNTTYIFSLEETNPGQQYFQIVCMLEKWKQKSGKEATISKLIQLILTVKPRVPLEAYRHLYFEEQKPCRCYWKKGTLCFDYQQQWTFLPKWTFWHKMSQVSVTFVLWICYKKKKKCIDLLEVITLSFIRQQPDDHGSSGDQASHPWNSSHDFRKVYALKFVIRSAMKCIEHSIFKGSLTRLSLQSLSLYIMNMEITSPVHRSLP